MKPFIRVTELWVPSPDGSELVFGGGLYGPLQDFKTVSEQTRFKPGEGLPGKAWKERHPVVLKEFKNSYFRRTEAAEAAGLTCGVALPIFEGAALKAVLVFLCGSDDEIVGAIEVWVNDEETSAQIGVFDGFYGNAELFEWTSKNIKFGSGIGLPGLVWSRGAPLIIRNAYQPDRFLRWKEGQKIGLNIGLGIPCPYDNPSRTWVMTFLSALGTPIAHRFEIWMPDEAQTGVKFHSGACDRNAAHSVSSAGKTIAAGEGFIGEALKSGVPRIVASMESEPLWLRQSTSAVELNEAVAMPVFERDGKLNSVVTWYF